MNKVRAELIQQAKNMLRGETATAEQLLQLAKKLKGEQAFDYARRRIRTDLDVFSNAEAFALMTSGYRMCEHEFAKRIRSFADPGGERPAWSFLAIEPLMKQTTGSEKFLSVLEVGAYRLLKPLRFFPIWWLWVLAGVLLVGAGPTAVLWYYGGARATAIGLGVAAVALVIGWLAGGIRWLSRPLDQLYLRAGSLPRVLGNDTPTEATEPKAVQQ